MSKLTVVAIPILACGLLLFGFVVVRSLLLPPRSDQAEFDAAISKTIMLTSVIRSLHKGDSESALNLLNSSLDVSIIEIDMLIDAAGERQSSARAALKDAASLRESYPVDYTEESIPVGNKVRAILAKAAQRQEDGAND